MVKYLNMHIKIFKKSFKLNRPILQSLLELAKYISLAVLLVLFLYVSIKFFTAVLPLLSSLDKISNINDFIADTSLVNIIMQQSNLLSLFVIKIILLLILTALVLSFILAIFNSIIITHVHNKRWNSKKFLKMLIAYSIITLIYFTIMFIILYYMLNIFILAISLILITMIYSYILLIFQLSVDNVSLLKYLKKGLVNCFKLHKTLPIIIIGVFVLAIILIICAFLAILLKQYVLIVMLPLIILWNIWMLNYQYHILHYVE